MKWLSRIIEYYRDKQLSEKCGLEAKDICVHEPTFVIMHPDGKTHTCIKCGEFYR